MRLFLGRQPRIEPLEGDPVPLAPRDAALLAWLAIEGPTSRLRLVALLWPESTEAQGMATLRQRLFKLRKSVGRHVAEGSPTLSLSMGIAHDSSDTPDLLGDVSLANAPELDAWLRARREKGAQREIASLQAREAELEARGDVSAALPLALALLRAEPASEAAHQRVMRLHHLQGDRAAALAAFDRCEQALKNEFGARPSPQTLALLAAIERGDVMHGRTPRQALSVAALRPPRMVGRERERLAMEDGWGSGKVVAVIGEAGMGKSRLIGEFMVSHAGIVRAAGRPGDAGIPFATFARLLRAVGDRVALDTFDADGRRQLARVLPELGESGPPLIEGQRLLLLRAAAGYLASARGLTGLAIDDLHFADAASLEMLLWLLSDDGQGGCRWLLAWRPAESDSPLRALQTTLAESAQLSTVELAPLDEEALAELVDQLGLNLKGASLAARLRQHTGGNPLFALETLRQAFIEGGGALAAGVGVLPRPQTVERLIDRRVAQLSHAALELARVASIAAVDFSISMAEAVLAKTAMQFADALNELEAAQVLNGTHFAHDLVFDAVRRSVPEAVARHAHAKVAGWLEQHQGVPARIARHWLDAGEAIRSLPWLRRAADQASAAFRNVESMAFLDQQADIEEGLGLREAAFETRLAGVFMYEAVVGSAEECDKRCDALDALADCEAQRIRAWLIRARLELHRRDLDGCERHARRALASATANGYRELVQRGQLVLFDALSQAHRTDEALALSEACLPWIDEFSDAREQIGFHSQLAMLYDSIGRLSSGQRHHVQAIACGERHRDLENQAIVVSNYANNRARSGQLRLAVAMRRQSARLASQVEGMHRHDGVLNTNLAFALAALGEYTESLALCDAAEERLVLSVPSGVAMVIVCRAMCWLHLGQRGRARQELRRMAQVSDGLLVAQVRQHLLAFEISRETGRSDVACLDAALALVDGDKLPHLREEVQMQLAMLMPPAKGLGALASVREQARQREFSGHVLATHVRAAELALAFDPALAREHAVAALAMAETFEFNGGYRAELWLHCTRALAAAGDDEAARRSLAAGVGWIQATTLSHVPEPFRSSFLHRNPVNAAMLALGL